jgi:hypothetical protein
MIWKRERDRPVTKFRQRPRTSTNVRERPIMDAHGRLWKRSDNRGRSDTHGRLWTFMDVLGQSWTFVDAGEILSRDGHVHASKS